MSGSDASVIRSTTFASATEKSDESTASPMASDPDEASGADATSGVCERIGGPDRIGAFGRIGLACGGCGIPAPLGRYACSCLLCAAGMRCGPLNSRAVAIQLTTGNVGASRPGKKGAEQTQRVRVRHGVSVPRGHCGAATRWAA
eukprot:2425916-Pleurochrysis_carterae.AAC.2